MMTREDAIKRTLADIQGMEEANSVLPVVRKVMRDFDGKVFNCRLEKALKEALPDHRIYVSTSYETIIEINFHPDHGSNNWITLLSGHKTTAKYYDPEKSFLTPEKRIDAAKALDLIEAKRVERLKRINEYKIFLENEQQIMQQLSILYKQIGTITATIPYTMRDYFGINRR